MGLVPRGTSLVMAPWGRLRFRFRLGGPPSRVGRSLRHRRAAWTRRFPENDLRNFLIASADAVACGNGRQKLAEIWKWRPRQDLNPQPSGPKPDALSVELRGRARRLSTISAPPLPRSRGVPGTCADFPRVEIHHETNRPLKGWLASRLEAAGGAISTDGRT